MISGVIEPLFQLKKYHCVWPLIIQTLSNSMIEVHAGDAPSDLFLCGMSVKSRNLLIFIAWKKYRIKVSQKQLGPPSKLGVPFPILTYNRPNNIRNKFVLLLGCPNLTCVTENQTKPFASSASFFKIK